MKINKTAILSSLVLVLAGAVVVLVPDASYPFGPSGSGGTGVKTYGTSSQQGSNGSKSAASKQWVSILSSCPSNLKPGLTGQGHKDQHGNWVWPPNKKGVSTVYIPGTGWGTQGPAKASSGNTYTGGPGQGTGGSGQPNGNPIVDLNPVVRGANAVSNALNGKP